MNINKLLGFGKAYGGLGNEKLGNKVAFTGIDVTDKSDYVSVMVSDMDERTLVKEVIDSYVSTKNRSKWLHRVDATLLNELSEMAKSHEHIEERVDHYTDEDDPTRCNWTDVEGIDYGWKWTKYPDNPEKVAEILRDDIYAFIESTVTDINNGLAIFVVVVELEDRVRYHFIGRPRLTADVIYTFADSEIDLF
ncbi:hypothetical protein Blue_091 [Bacillus phage Deep Blue]|uniref:Uncharacterized protein n=1 Tax=Bacillus phage Deep Blue TaxID=1792245 RepID=A0A140HLQ2_9CAUD|nr:hypothetical protein Blue_091 [Bacillus phage Deep Blue]AMO25914.1 hypothetical protein Blue_091 [Bacillus phage Deep Blue]